MKVLFIGGTGRLSNDIAKLSCECGNQVYVLTRGTPERKKFIDKRFNLIYSDIRNVSETKKILSNYMFDIVIDFLSYDVNQLKMTLNVIEKKYSNRNFLLRIINKIRKIIKK